VKKITSRQNAVVTRYRAAARGAEPGVVLLDGPHLIEEAFGASVPLRHAIVNGDMLDREVIAPLVEHLTRGGVEVAQASASVMASVSPVRSASPIVALGDRPSHREDRLFAGSSPFIVIACDVQDPGNMGAIARVAEAAGVSGLVAAGRSADPFGWKALRGSMGSAFRLPIRVDGNIGHAIARTRHHRCRIVATAPRDGRSMVEADLSGPLAVLIGGEGPGLPVSLLEAADELVTIPMQPPVESLNTAVAAALIVYEARRQRKI
jgi:TrmH family RNA methyltransferase